MSSGMLSSGMLGAIVYLGLGSLAVAQLPKSAAPAPAAKSESPPPVDAEPNSTSANFGDWTLRCQRLGNGAETRRVCEVTQQIRAGPAKPGSGTGHRTFEEGRSTASDSRPAGQCHHFEPTQLLGRQQGARVARSRLAEMPPRRLHCRCAHDR